MGYRSLEACIVDLERNKQLVRVKEEVDPTLEMAAIQLAMYERQGPAILFERVKGTSFRAVTNLFGTIERARFMFRDTLEAVQKVITLKQDPAKALKNPLGYIGALGAGVHALPLRGMGQGPVMRNTIAISDLPLIKNWPKDGGAFITLPQVYSEDISRPGISRANLGMYRIQLNGNDYIPDKEIGLHYQIHRGIGVHQSLANEAGHPLKVSIFVGGPPAHTLAAVMPLPEGLSETMFAGLLGGRRFRYTYDNRGHCISSDADFVITGTIHAGEVKREGPFGDHLGYYSLEHDFPVMRVEKVYAKTGAIWPFTVVGRPPQEDSTFGALIHEITGDAIQHEIPGVRSVHAVDEAGVHPLLLAVGSERYTPYAALPAPSELLTQANRILGTGQLSLAKYLFIAAPLAGQLSANDTRSFIEFVLERFDPKRDLHFQTQTSIDTLDYSGEGLNKGSKIIWAAYGHPLRKLDNEIPSALSEVGAIREAVLVSPGIVAIKTKPWTGYADATTELSELTARLLVHLDKLTGVPLIILCDRPEALRKSYSYFLWVTFTRSNPSHDIYGVGEQTLNKHWGCTGPVIIDARMKRHMAPELETDSTVLRSIERLYAKGGSLEGWG